MTDDDEPIAYHFFDTMEEAIEAAKAADVLGLGFVLQSEEQEEEPEHADGTRTTSIRYILTVLPPGYHASNPLHDEEDEDETEGES